MIHFLLYLLFLIVGATAVFIYYKIRPNTGSQQHGNKPDQLNTDTSTGIAAAQKDGHEALPSEPAAVSEKTENNLPQNTEELKTGNREIENPDMLKKMIDDLYIVNELGQNVTSSLNLQETFEHLYTTVNSMMDAAVLELGVVNDTTRTWKIISNLEQDGAPGTVPYSNHLAEWCFKNNREAFLSDAENDYGRYVFKPLVMPGGRVAKSAMAFPILNKDVISGTLCIVSFTKNSFEEYHMKIIRLLLGYISVAMQNAITHEELNVTKQRAERSEKFMQQFLANMSHEIRTPINAVTGMTRLLLEKDPRSEQLKYLESIRNASDSLLVIINDILDLSKIEAGKIEFEQIDFSVFDVVENVKEIMRFKAEEKGLILETHCDEQVPPVLVGDPTRLIQILINLVGNAVKFTEKGKVKISVGNLQLAKEDNLPIANCQLIFQITDTGIGMTEEQQQKLFQNYSQVSTDTTRKYGGTGLGLSISKQLVQLQGGMIEVKSASGEGSTFSFTLSYPVSKNKAVARKEKTVSKEMLQRLKGIKILLADDNEYNRIVVKETLQLKIEGVYIDEVTDGAMAVEKIKEKEYDVVLMDLVMPQMDGLEATHEIRHRLPAPKNQIKIVALTASVVKSEIDKCFASGMNGFIPKPFKPYELLGGIYRVLHGENETNFEVPAVSNGIPKSPGKLIDLDYLRDFTEGDPVRLQRYVDLFLTKTPVAIETLRSALKKNDYEKIRIAAHSMKPQLRFTGVLQGLEFAETIEQNCAEKINLDQLPGLIQQLNSICDSAMEEMKTLNRSEKKQH